MANQAPVPSDPQLPTRDFTFIMDRLRWIDGELTRRRDIEWKITALHAAVYTAVIYLLSGERAKLSDAIGTSTPLCWLFYAFVVSYALIASCHLVYTHLRLNRQRGEKETLLRQLGQDPEPLRLRLWGFFEGWGAIFPTSFVAFVWVLGAICVLLPHALTVEENPPMPDSLTESVNTIFGGWPWATIWTAVAAFAVVITGAIICYQAGVAAKALRFEAFAEAQRIFTKPCFVKNRGMVFKKRRALAENEWTGDEREAALDVCRQMDRIAHLYWQGSIKKKLALMAWDDPVGKAWFVLEPLVEHERTDNGWPQKWHAFQFFGAAAIDSLKRKSEGNWPENWKQPPAT